MKHTISILVEQEFNALSRIIGLFSGRGFKIDSITFGSAEKPGVSRLTITTNGDEKVIDQITRQLEKLVDVIKVTDLTNEPFVDRELALIKVSVSKKNSMEIIQVANVFRGAIIDISQHSMTIEITGKEDKINAAIEMLYQFGLIEVARTGIVALRREYRNVKTTKNNTKQEV